MSPDFGRARIATSSRGSAGSSGRSPLRRPKPCARPASPDGRQSANPKPRRNAYWMVHGPMPRTFPSSRAACLRRKLAQVRDRQRAAGYGLRRGNQIFRFRSRKLQLPQRLHIQRCHSFRRWVCAQSALVLQTQRRDQLAAQRHGRLQADLLAHNRPRERLPRLGVSGIRKPRCRWNKAPSNGSSANCRSKPPASESIPSIRTTARCARECIPAIHTNTRQICPRTIISTSDG